MANKFDDIDESKIIKKSSNNVKEENVQQPKTEQKIQPKVQAKVQAKVQPKVQVKQTIKQENIEVKEVKNTEVKTEQKQIKVKQSIESEVKPKIKEKEVKIETNKVEIKSEAVNHVEEVNKNESKKTEINITEKIESKKSFPVFNVDPVTKETSPVSNFNYDSREDKSEMIIPLIFAFILFTGNIFLAPLKLIPAFSATSSMAILPLSAKIS